MSEGAAVDVYLADGDLTASAWAQALRDGLLLGQRCPDGHVTAAPKAACAHCGERELAVEALPTEGTVYAETTVEVSPVGFEAPYGIAIVDLGDARVLARTSVSVEIGDSVALDGVVEHDGTPAPVFEPV